MRYRGRALLVLGTVVGLLVAWLELSHLWFAICAVVVVTILTGVVALWDGMRQTTTQNLRSRGITPESAAGGTIIDPGLRRGEWTPVFGGGATRRSAYRPRRSAAPAAPAAPAARPAARPKRPPASTTSMANRARSGSSRRRGGVLQQDATVTLAGERQVAGIDDLMLALDSELIGLVPVKKKVEEIGSLLLVDRARQRFGLSASRPNLHMCFTGSPGTGKTTVALMMADLLLRLGYLEKGHLVHAMRDDLVGEYIGQTAPKTKAVLDRAMGGVLFIDEAYALYRAQDSKDYGQECIDILMQVMENDRDKLVVILAGYKDRMDNFFESNPGMSSRIAHHLDFAEYEVDELLAIGRLMLDRSSYYLSDDAEEVFRDHLSVRMRQPRFANARSVRNDLESARLRHAYRLAADPEREWSKDDLMRLEPSDILSPRAP
jgi:probable Rubsico expression protein CbbX